MNTKAESFHSLSITGYLQPNEQIIVAAFKGRADVTYTRQQLVSVVGMPLNAVCGRANSLLTKKALRVRGFHIDPATRKPQELLGLPVVEQRGLFE